MDEIRQMMELMDRPAFCVEDGRIAAANSAALARQFAVGDEVEPLLASGAEEYREFKRGCLCLTLRCCGEQYDAAITALEHRQLFCLDSEEEEAELRVLSLAAQELREPLGNVMSLVDDLDTDPELLARINRGLYQLLRIVGNMSPHPVPRFEMMDVNALLRELWDKVLPAFESRDTELIFTPHPAPVYSCVDGSFLTRAIHNLLSNSLKFSEPGGSVHLELTVRRRFLRITVRNDCDLPTDPSPDPFTRFRREAGISDGRYGIGLGLKIVRSAATAHGGTVLLDRPENRGFRVTLTLPIRQDSAGLRSTRYHISYSGERDPMLIELSDVLPPEFYKN